MSFLINFSKLLFNPFFMFSQTEQNTTPSCYNNNTNNHTHSNSVSSSIEETNNSVDSVESVIPGTELSVGSMIEVRLQKW